MSLEKAVTGLVGDYARFGSMADRVEGLVESQLSNFVPARSNWLVLPWGPRGGEAGFYLFSEDREGQRRGREVLTGFLGPSIATFESVPSELLVRALPDTWRATGLGEVSLIRRIGPRDVMLARFEEAVATSSGRNQVEAELQVNHVDLLRDVRLAMLGKDSTQAFHLLEQLKLTGELSAENLRFLTIELCASFGRWQEMAQLPYIRPMMLARRPRAVTESLLQMIWWTELAPHLSAGSVATVFATRGLVDRFGGLLRVIQIPSSAPGRILTFLTAVADGHSDRQQEILAAVDDEESAALSALLEPLQDVAPGTTASEPESMRSAFDLGMFPLAVDIFLTDPTVDRADMAVEAVLELGAHQRAADVLQIVQGWVTGGELTPGRRLIRDLDELGHLVAGACSGWVEWAERLGAVEPWADAASVLRNQWADWIGLADLPASQVAQVANGIYEAVGSVNESQLRASLDVLCEVAAEIVSQPACSVFCEVVLQVLSDQENVSVQVRDSYAVLFAAILAAGPTRESYLEILTQTGQLWGRIKSRSNVDWAFELLEVAIEQSSPDRDQLNAFGASIVLTARSYPLTVRQRVDAEALASEFGLSPLPVIREQSEEDGEVWGRLDGKVVGLYSLLGRAIPRFTDRVAALCSPGEVRGNDDTTATAALTNLAERADYLVVDTWHAAHQATGAIDAVRPRDRQILPKQRGVSGFMRSLEEALDN